jgi:hypothetical protein
VSATATLAHPDRLVTRDRTALAPSTDVDLAVEHLATLIAGTDGDPLEALEAVARAASRLARSWRRQVPLDDERPAPMMGSWSLDNGVLPHIVLGEN